MDSPKTDDNTSSLNKLPPLKVSLMWCINAIDVLAIPKDAFDR